MTSKSIQYKYDRRVAAREYVQGILKRLACVQCGFKDSRALDFHHEPRLMELYGAKVDSVSRMVSTGEDMKVIRLEIKKCVVLCSNCHRIHHWEDRQRAKGDSGFHDGVK